MNHNLSPECLSALIPQQVSNTSRYNLRNSDNIQTIRAKTTQYQIFFLLSILKNWIDLPTEAKQISTYSLGSFKYFLKKDKKVCVKTLLFWKQKDPLHTRLRTGCSSLNLDLFLKNNRFTAM